MFDANLINYSNSNNERYGGANWDNATASTFTNGIGQVWNDVSGATAQNQFNSVEAQLSRQFNSAEAEHQRQFEEHMSNTAHQREVADLMKAGINPLLSSGAGASTPTGSSAASAPASATAGGAQGGFLGLIMKAANVAIAKGLEAKFTHSAMRAADNHELITQKVRSLAAQEQYYSARASRLGSLFSKDDHGPQPAYYHHKVTDEDVDKALASLFGSR